MATKPFHYQEMFPLGPDTTEYYIMCTPRTGADTNFLS